MYELTPTQRKILMALEDSGGLSAKDLARAIGISVKWTRDVLVIRLTNMGMIEQVHGGNSTPRGGKPSRYQVTEFGLQHSKAADEFPT